MQFGIISIIPEVLQSVNYGILGRALKNQASLQIWDPRDFTEDKHRTVDDRPYGGGPGMLMKVEPLKKAIQAAKAVLPKAKTIYLSPQAPEAHIFNQQRARELAKLPGIIFVCGRYEGIDERLIETEIDEEWSIGDYVLSGGELAAAVMMDGIVRLLPGALGHELSAAEDSFEGNLLDFPHYTRPEKMDEGGVPEVLLRGNHAAIAQWRRKQALGRTWQRRPDLLAQRELAKEDQALLDEFKDKCK
jgi:tRNA (guanine37-N1)-methyltransferase